MTEAERVGLRRLVRSFYDLQRLRIQSSGRSDERKNGALKKRASKIEVDAESQVIITRTSDGLLNLEAELLADIEPRVEAQEVGRWLLDIRGIGPTLAGVILAEVDIRRAPTVSALWRYAGLSVVAGKRERRQKGARSPYNGFLKTKLAGVTAMSILKACVRATPQAKGEWHKVAWEASAIDREQPDSRERATHAEQPTEIERADIIEQPGQREHAVGHEHTGFVERPFVTRYVTGYAKVYADYRWRLLHRVGPCAMCNAASGEQPAGVELAESGEQPRSAERAGLREQPDSRERADNREKTASQKRLRTARCANCDGTGVGPWGKSSAHRHQAAASYMVKILLKDLWLAWRTMEGLPVSDPYAVAKLGLRDHPSVALRYVAGAAESQ